MLIQVWREALSPCAYGVMTIEGEFFGLTLELPWKDNAPRISCIIAGTYEVRISRSFKLRRNALEILGVPGRAGIRIHGANRADQLRGCLAVSRSRPTLYTLQGDLSKALQVKVQAALQRGDLVEIQIINPKESA